MTKWLFRFVLFFIALELILYCLTLASQKNFWGDEHFELTRVIVNRTGLELLWKGADGTPSLSPLYYLIERYWIRFILFIEKEFLVGMDWRISFRLLPTISAVFLSIVVPAIALRKYIPHGVYLFIILMATNKALIWSATETRLYAFWIGLSACFYTWSILTAQKGFADRDIFWLGAGAAFLPLTINTAPVQVVTVFGTLIVFLVLSGSFNKWIAAKLITVSILSMLTSLFYDLRCGWERGTPMGWAEFFSKFPPFSDLIASSFLSVGGMSGFLLMFSCSVALIFLGWRKDQSYLLVGGLGLSQITCVFILRLAHFKHNYIFVERHGVFLVPVMAILFGFFFQWLCVFHSEQRRVFISILILVAAFVFSERIIGIPNSISLIRQKTGRVCNGGLRLVHTVETFNLLNEAKHSNNCQQPTSLGPYFDYTGP